MHVERTYNSGGDEFHSLNAVFVFVGRVVQEVEEQGKGFGEFFQEAVLARFFEIVGEAPDVEGFSDILWVRVKGNRIENISVY